MGYVRNLIGASLIALASLRTGSAEARNIRPQGLDNLILDAKVTDLKTGKPISYTAKFFSSADFKARYSLEITEPDKVGVEISATDYVTCVTAGYLEPDVGVVHLQSPYGDNERALIPESDELLKQMCDVICRPRGRALMKHPNPGTVKYQMKTASDTEAQIGEEVLVDAVKRATNGTINLPSGSLVKNPNLVKGKIAETLFAQMLRETGHFTVLEFCGYQ